MGQNIQTYQFRGKYGVRDVVNEETEGTAALKIATRWRKRAGVLVSLAVAPLTLYYALPIAIPYGLPAVLITIFLVTAEITAGLFLGYEVNPKLWIQSLALSGAVSLIVGLIFSTPLPLELKLWVGLLVFVSVSLARLYHVKRKKLGWNATCAS